MAKIGIIFLGLLTVHVTLVAPRNTNDVEIDDYVSQIQDTSARLSLVLQKEIPNSKFVANALTWNILKTSQAFGGIIKQLRDEKNKYNEDIDRSIDSLLGQFLSVTSAMDQTEVYVDTKDVASLEQIIDIKIQTIGEEIVKLARYVETYYSEGSVGTLHVTIKCVLVDFSTALQDVYATIENLSRTNSVSTFTEEMKVKIQKLTSMLVNRFDGNEYEDEQALKVFIRNVDFILEELNKVTIEDKDVHSVLQQFAKKLQELLLQINSSSNLNKSKAIVDRFQDVCVIVDQLLFDVETRFLETSSRRFIHNLIQNYTRALKYFLNDLKFNFNEDLKVYDEIRPFRSKNNLAQSSGDSLSPKSYIGRARQIFPVEQSSLNIYLATVANNLDVSLRLISLNNEIGQRILFDQLKEFVVQLDILIGKIERLIYNRDYGSDVLRDVFENLRNIVRNSRDIRNISDVSRYFKGAIGEMEKLIGLEKGDKPELTEIVYDFISILRNQQIQLENINKTNFLRFNVQQLIISIRTTTDTLIDLLKRTPANDGILVRKIQVKIGHFVKIIETIVDKLNDLCAKETNASTVLENIVLKLQQIMLSLKTLNTIETYATTSELTFQLNHLLQHTASYMEELSLLPQQEAIKQILIEYCYFIQNMELNIHRMIETGQTGRTPRELALHIQIATQKISEFSNQNDENDDDFVWQARRFLQSLEITIDKLKFSSGVFRKVEGNLIKIKSSFRQTLNDIHDFDRLRTEFEFTLKNTAREMETIALISQGDFQESYVELTGFARGIIIDHLYTLEQIERQIQNGRASKLDGHNSSIMKNEIRSIANKLYDIFPQIQHHHHKQTMIVQIGQLVQTIENMINVIDMNRKYNKNQRSSLGKIAKNLKRISKELQEILTAESKTAINELSVRLEFGVRNVIDQVQKMPSITQSESNARNEVIKTVFNNLLSTLRNMYNQIDVAVRIGENPTQVFAEIETFTNLLVLNLNTETSGSEIAKQALTIDIFKYAAQIQKLIVKIDSDPNARDILQNLRQTVAYLQQSGEAWASLTTADLKTALSNQIQSVSGQMRAPITKNVILDYLAVLENLHVQIQRTFSSNHNLSDRIENAAMDLIEVIRKIPLHENRMEDTIFTAEAGLLKVVTNMVQILSSDEQNEKWSNVVDQLRDIHLKSNPTVNEQEARMQFLLQMQLVGIAVNELKWANDLDVVRTALDNFLSFVQGVHIRVRINVRNYEKRYGYEFHLRKYNEDFDREGYPKTDAINKDVVGYGEENAFDVHNFKNVKIDKYTVRRRNEQQTNGQGYFKYAEVDVNKDDVNKNKITYKYGTTDGEKGYGYDFGLKKYNPNLIEKNVRGFGYDRFYDQYEINRNSKDVLIDKYVDERVRSI